MEEIIIDGVDVSECIHFGEWSHCDICKGLIKTKKDRYGKPREHLLTEGDLRCDFYNDCYYKQLLRKEKECEELNKLLKQYKYDLDKSIYKQGELVLKNSDLYNKKKQTQTSLAKDKGRNR